MEHCMLLLIVSVIAVFHGTHSTHFIGGTLSWRYAGNGKTIILVYFLNTNGSKTDIDDGTKFELYVDGIVLPEGNSPTVNTVQAARSESLTWNANKGSNTIINTEVGLDRISYFGSVGVELYYPTGSSSELWQLTTYLDLADRPDTGQINNSPVVLGIPYIAAEKGCSYTIRIPVFDPDGDNIKCRLATGPTECGDVCDTRVPGTNLDSTSCTLTFNTSSADVANYAMMVQVEDYISSTSLNPLSSVPFQFVVQVRETPLNCNSEPVFVSPTPEEGSCIPLKVGVLFTLTINATTTGGATITEIPSIGPSALSGSGSTLGSSSRTLQWTPSAADSGLHLLCFQAIDSISTGSEQRCVNLNVGGVTVTATSRMGAVPIDHSTWTITFNAEFQAPSSNQFIKIYDNAPVLQEIIDISNGTNFVIGTDNLSATFETTFEKKAETLYTVYLPPTFIFGTGECGKQQLSNWTFIVKDCGLPVPPDNGLVNSETNKTLYESTFTIECNTGYENTPGSDTITCNENGSWTEGANCTKKDCGLPVPPDNGLVNSETNKTLYESTFTIECNTGYENTPGSDTITCNENGSWTEGANCTKKDCGLPVPPDNGLVNSETNKTLYESTFTIECNTGYENTPGSDTITCNENGSWTEGANCTKKDCGLPVPPDNGLVNSETNKTLYESTFTIECNTGYENTPGSDTITCNENGSWTEGANCTKKDCGLPVPPDNGLVNSETNKTLYESTFTIECNTGYENTPGSDTITCNENGSWTEGANCTKKDCGLPVPPDNGLVKSETNKTLYESTFTIECNTGYENTSGSDTITCNENGSWTEGATCTKKDCGTVPTLTNGARNDTGGTTYGDTATFACNTGYTISGDAAVTCQADGTWETLPATCTIKDCGKVTIPINAYILTVNHTAYFRSMVTFQCNTRYLFKSSVRQIECTENGTWTKGPTCIPADAVGLITVMGISAGAVVVLLSVGLTLGVTITIMRKQRLQRFKSRVPAPDYDDIPRPDYDDYDSNPRRDYDDNAFNPGTLFSNGTAPVFHN